MGLLDIAGASGKGKCMLCNVVFATYLVAASVSDIKTHRVPLWMGLAAAGTRAVFLAIPGSRPLAYILPAALLFGILSAMAVFGGLGGADCIAGTLCGLYMGFAGIWAILFASAAALPYTLYMRFNVKEKEYPFLPFIAGGAALAACIHYIG